MYIYQAVEARRRRPPAPLPEEETETLFICMGVYIGMPCTGKLNIAYNTIPRLDVCMYICLKAEARPCRPAAPWPVEEGETMVHIWDVYRMSLV